MATNRVGEKSVKKGANQGAKKVSGGDGLPEVSVVARELEVRYGGLAACTTPASWLDLGAIAASGQAFRWVACTEGWWAVPAAGGAALLRCVPRVPDTLGTVADSLEMRITPQHDLAWWRRYLALSDDYGLVLAELGDLRCPAVDAAMAFSQGVRVLHQNPFEAFATSIVTQNNNIPRITACVERLCGGSLEPWPGPEELLARLEEPGACGSLGLGYRLPYLRDLCRRWLDGEYADMVALSAHRTPFDRDELATCERDVALLMRCEGVGPKVARCCALFGLAHASAVPVDVWIKRVERDKDVAWLPQIAGIEQQFVFAWARAGYPEPGQMRA